MIRLIEAPDAPDAAADEDDAAMQVEVAAGGGRGEGGGVSEGGGAEQGAEHGGKEGEEALQASAHAHATTFPHAHAASAAENGDATRFATEAESALWEPGGALVEGEEHTLSARQLALQSLAELSQRLGRPEGTLKSDISRLRAKCQQMIRDQVAATLDDPTPDNITADLKELMGYRASS
jgi:uncharacterized small protein (DUF1192 family)